MNVLLQIASLVALSYLTIFFCIILPLNKAARYHVQGVLIYSACNSGVVETISVLGGLVHNDVSVASRGTLIKQRRGAPRLESHPQRGRVPADGCWAPAGLSQAQARKGPVAPP